jgi:nickel-dependent lactate racemase
MEKDTSNARASIHACRKADRHIVAMEGEKEIFKSLLEPLNPKIL